MKAMYKELFRIPNKKYCNDSPVVIDAAAIYKNKENNSIVAQLKITNISNESIIACKVKIRAYEVDKTTLIKEIIYSYLDLNISLGQIIGSKVPIALPSNTRYFDVEVTDVTFLNNTAWISSDTWEQIPEQPALEDIISNKTLVEEINYHTKINYIFYPRIYKKIFQCSCGTTNAEYSSCTKCGKSYEELINLLDETNLQQLLNERKKQEAVEQKQKEILKKEKEIKKKKYIKITSIILGALCFIFIFKAVFTFTLDIIHAQKIKASNNFIQVISNDSFEKYPSIWNERSTYDGFSYTYHNHKFKKATFDIDVYYYDNDETMVDKVEFSNNSFSEESYEDVLDSLIHAFGDDYEYSEKSGYDENVNLCNKYIYTWNIGIGDHIDVVNLEYKDTGTIKITRSYH